MRHVILCFALLIGTALPAVAASDFDGDWTGHVVETRGNACDYRDTRVYAQIDDGEFTSAIDDPSGKSRIFKGELGEDGKLEIWVRKWLFTKWVLQKGSFGYKGANIKGKIANNIFTGTLYSKGGPSEYCSGKIILLRGSGPYSVTEVITAAETGKTIGLTEDSAKRQKQQLQEGLEAARAENKRLIEEVRLASQAERQRILEEAKAEAEAERKRLEEQARLAAEKKRQQEMAQLRRQQAEAKRRAEEEQRQADLSLLTTKEERIALVIGNGDYDRTIGALANPPKDARLIATTLRGLGFEVLESLDVDQRAMKRAVKNFGDKLEVAGKDAVGLFYYAGHGVQVRGTNYLIPIGAEIDREKDVDIESVSANAVLSNMEYAGNRVNIVIMDACRNNPFTRSFRSVAQGLAKMSATTGTLIAYSTGPGEVAADGSGANSPYTLALSRGMNTPGLTVERMFKQVRNDVLSKTNKLQTPWESSSLTGADFYFKGGAATIVSPQASPTLPSGGGTSPEVAFWQSIQNSNDASDFEAYLSQFPNGIFAALARNRLKKMK